MYVLTLKLPYDYARSHWFVRVYTIRPNDSGIMFACDTRVFRLRSQELPAHDNELGARWEALWISELSGWLSTNGVLFEYINMPDAATLFAAVRRINVQKRDRRWVAVREYSSDLPLLYWSCDLGRRTDYTETEYEANMRSLCATLNEELVASPSHSPLVSNDNEEGAENSTSFSISISSSAEATASATASLPDEDEAQSTASASPSRPPDVSSAEAFRRSVNAMASVAIGATESMGDFGRQLRRLDEFIEERIRITPRWGPGPRPPQLSSNLAEGMAELTRIQIRVKAQAKIEAERQAKLNRRIEEAGRPPTRSKAIELDPDT